MTPKQIVKASNGNAHISKEANKELLAISEHTTGPFHFNVSFLSTDGSGKLTKVRLKLLDGTQFDALKSALINEYGTGDCKKWVSTGIVGVPKDVEKCLWITDHCSIQLSSSYTRIVGWTPNVVLDYFPILSSGL